MAHPLDTDSDGTDDFAEMQNKRANPLNPARLIPADDGAIIVPSRGLFDSISHRDNFPGSPNVREVKFLIMGANTANPALYFLNVNRHQYHYYFARDVLGSDELHGVSRDEGVVNLELRDEAAPA